jgi:hypothetical protein
MVQFGIELSAPSHPASGPAAERQYVRRHSMRSNWRSWHYASASPKSLILLSLASLIMIGLLFIVIARVGLHTQDLVQTWIPETEEKLRTKIDTLPIEKLREFVLDDSALIERLIDYVAVISVFSTKVLFCLAWLIVVNVLITFWAILYSRRASKARAAN